MIIKIYTKDENTILSGLAVKDDGSAYLQSEISKIRIFRNGPRNDSTLYPAIVAEFTNPGTNTDNNIQAKINGTLPKEGYWGFQFEYTLTSSTKPIYSKIFHEYVGPTITTDGSEVDGSVGGVIANSVTFNGEILLFNGSAITHT